MAQIGRRESLNVRRCTARPWDAIAAAHKAYPTYIRERRIFDQSGGFKHCVLRSRARAVRLASRECKTECGKNDRIHGRSPCFVGVGALFAAPIHDDFEKLKLADSLGFMVELLAPITDS
jgi:hypothetical protein